MIQVRRHTMSENPIIMNLVNQILDFCNPLKIILFSKKYNLSHELTSFKLCVIVPDDVDVTELECRIYLELESENPYDVVIYKKTEWEHHLVEENSFAGVISRTGVVLYEL